MTFALNIYDTSYIKIICLIMNYQGCCYARNIPPHYFAK